MLQHRRILVLPIAGVARECFTNDSATILTVATDGSGDFTKIGDAISQAQSKNIPTITVLAGIYSAVTVSATPTVTILAETDNKNDFSRNKVAISNDGTALVIAADVAGITFKNINFINTASSGEAVILRGSKNGFYSSQLISAGSIAITAELGLGVIANGYIEAAGEIISGGANLYIFNTLIVPTSDDTVIVSNQGTTSDDTLYNSTIVLDQSTISAKTGVDIANVSLAAAGGPGSVVVYRSSSLGSLITATGFRVDDKTQDDSNFYGEYDNSGPGAFAENAYIRLPYVTLLTSSGLTPFTLDAVLADGNPEFATSDTSWVDPAVLAAIESADVISYSTSTSDGSVSSPGSGDDNDDSGSSSEGDGNGSGDDNGSGSGSGDDNNGSGSGEGGNDNGSGSASSSDSGSGSADDDSSGSGDDGNGTGTGDDGNDSDSGSGSGSGSSSDSGSGSGKDGSRSDSSSDSGSGSGDDNSSGSGSGSGSGDDDNGTGTGDDGNGSGSSSDSGSGSGDAGNESGDDDNSSGSDTGSGSGSETGDGDNDNGDVFVVSKTPSKGEYSSVTSALSALPNDGKPYTISIKAGTYQDQITISRDGKVTIRGETSFANDFTENRVTIEAPEDSEGTLSITIQTEDGALAALYNIDFQNKNAETSSTAAFVVDFHGKVAAYGCSFIGYQNTLLAKQGTQVFSNSYIEGSTDFIWGFSTVFFHQSCIAINTAGGFIAAQSRSSANAKGGFVIDSSVVTSTSAYGDDLENTYLGRPYSEYSLVVYMNTYLGKVINPAGWHVWSESSPRTGHVSFFEYSNTGPGSWSDSRVPFAKKLSKDEAEDYTLSNWIGDTSWLDMKAYNLDPSYDLTNPSPATPASGSSPSTSTSTPSASATWAHPSSGTTPPAGSIIVSQSKGNGAYSNLTAALASLPSDDTTQIIFVYPGSYNEQIPTIDRDGAVMIIGYTEKDPGRGYNDNGVTITFSRGMALPASGDHTDSETATVSTASKKIAFYNINIVNTANLDGSKSSYVTVAGSISGSHIAFYGCSFVGWQGTLLTGGEGYQYYESSYIEGAIDIISGSATAYFKGCTIGAKGSDSAFTAQSRPSSKTGGYIFDQCYFGAAFYAPTDPKKAVYLGRPRSEYALVVVKNSYLSSVINPSGWEAWSRDDPRTDHVLFGEYKNTGPGNWENNKDLREAVGFGKLLDSDDYSLEEVMDSTDWIDLTYFDSITTPQEIDGSTPASSNGTSPNSTSAASDGTTPPSGAYIVSKTKIEDTLTYESIHDALDALPSSPKVSTIFVYPGTYEEQLTVPLSGTVILIGYSKSVNDFSANRVTIKHDAGVEISSGQSSSDAATVYATGGQFQAININFANFNDDEKTTSTAFAVKASTYAGLYGCQVVGGQGALLVNGYIFASNTYIEGSGDIILGSGAGYFLNSTLSPTKEDISLTADRREKGSLAGLVFDQSTVTPAARAGPLSNVALGRPWNSLARVVYINSYLESLVKAAGWDQWSSSSPRTDDVLFGEYGNSGPGSDTSDRAPFASQLDDNSVAQFEIGNFFKDTSWIDFSRVPASPFKTGNGKPSSTTATSTTPTSSDATASDATDANSSTSTSPEGAQATTTEANAGQTLTTTLIETVAGKGSIKTVKSTTTLIVTSTAAQSTITSKSTVTTTSVKTANVKTSKFTSTVTVSIGPEETTTTQVQPTTVFSTKTDTKSVTTTLSCVPARVARRHLQPRSRDATTTVAQSSTMTDFAHTSTATEISSHREVANTPAATATVTTTSTTTLDGPISTTSVKYVTETAKLNPPPVIVVSTKTKTVKAVLTLPAVTSTKIKTMTYTRSPSATVTSQSISTTTQLITSTRTQTVTTTAKDATACDT